MEGFIIFLVVTLIGFVVNKAKEGSEDVKNKRKQMPPMGQGPLNKKNTQTPQRTGLGDYMKKMAQEVEKSLGEVPKQEVERKMQEYKQVKDDSRSLLEDTRVAREEYIRPTRPTMEQTKVASKEQAHKLVKRNRVVPKTKQGIMQAIVMSEILAPPVSKRKK